MKYEVTFSCGHTETVDLFGSSKERERKIAYYKEHGECSECYNARREAMMNAVEAKYNLPALEGTEKQVAWARKIRQKRMDEFNSICEQFRNQIERSTDPNKDEIMKKSEEQMNFMKSKIASVVSAKFFIETQDVIFRAWVSQLMK